MTIKSISFAFNAIQPTNFYLRRSDDRYTKLTIVIFITDQHDIKPVEL